MTSCQNNARPRRQAGFTLVELLVVVSIIALLVAILLPSLKKAREQTKQVVCLANMKAFGTGVMTYTGDYTGRLPGPLHPAVYRYQTIQSYADWGTTDPAAAKKLRDRQITWVTRQAMGQKGDGEKKNVTDAISTCPVLAGIVSDQHFKNYKAANSKQVFPVHYAVNNYGAQTAEQSGFVGNVRQTNPPYYFGFSPPPGTETQAAMVAEVQKNPPRALEKIRKGSDEWMVADAWFRSVAGTSVLPQQAGPYQVAWSGEAMPYFAPHFRIGSKEVPLDSATRSAAANQITRNNKTDGTTPTVYFDGHAFPVRSKTLKVLRADGTPTGAFGLYGYPGTVNMPANVLNLRFAWE